MNKFTENLLTRRSLLQLAAQAASYGLLSSTSFAGKEKTPFGVAIALEPFRNDPKLKEMLVKYADVFVPMNALKWGLLRPSEDQFDFSGADEIIRFAELHGRPVHGHTLLWYDYNPDWLSAKSTPSKLERALREHIQAVAGRYAGRIASWDVVNEVVAHDPLSEGKWRRGIWYDVLGPRHVDIAFEEAARVDPAAKLYINDYDLEDDSLRTKSRQDAIISIVRRLQDKKIPIHGVGLQAHLYAERGIGKENLIDFVKQLEKLGLEVAVTELDIIDWKLSKDIERRDRGVAATAKEFLDAITSATTLSTLTTWGMNDRYSWIGSVFERSDDGKARPLPFDENWQPKPLFDVISNVVKF